MEIKLTEEEKQDIAKKMLEEKEKKEKEFSQIDEDIQKSETNLVNFAGDNV